MAGDLPRGELHHLPLSRLPYTSWTEIGTYATPDSATLPDNSSGDSSPASTEHGLPGADPRPTSCAGEQELTFNDTGATSGTDHAGVTYLDTPMPAGWTPPVVENANELPWEQNPYFNAALTAAGITTVGADASKAYPNPPDGQFGIGATYTGPTYAAGQPFVDGTAQVAPRHPINVFYNVATNAQELDEYNTLYDANAPGQPVPQHRHDHVLDDAVHLRPGHQPGRRRACSRTCCPTTPRSATCTRPTSWARRRTPASCPRRTTSRRPPPQPGTSGDGTLYEVLNPLIAEYDSYFNTNTPYVQLTLGGIGNTLADQTAWAATLAQASRRP